MLSSKLRSAACIGTGTCGTDAAMQHSACCSLQTSLQRSTDSACMCRQRHPVVFWPAYGTSVLNVEVANVSQANCPSSGSFQVAFGEATL